MTFIVKQVYWYISQISAERLQDNWSSGLIIIFHCCVILEFPKQRKIPFLYAGLHPTYFLLHFVWISNSHIMHKNLLWNRWTDFKETWHEVFQVNFFKPIYLFPDLQKASNKGKQFQATWRIHCGGSLNNLQGPGTHRTDSVLPCKRYCFAMALRNSPGVPYGFKT